MIRSYFVFGFLSFNIINGFQYGQLPYRSWKPRSPFCQLESHRSFLEGQREDLGEALKRIDELKDDLKNTNSKSDLMKLRSEINLLVDEMAENLVALVPPIGLSSEDYVDAMRMYLQLPPSIRYALVKSLNMEGYKAGEYQEIPEIVAALYEKQTSPSPQIWASLSILNTSTNGNAAELIQNDDALLNIETNTTTEREATFKTFFGYVSRNTKISPTSEEMAIITRILKDAKFVPASDTGKPIEFEGAYVIPGIDRNVDSEKLLNCIDANIPEDWECSVSLIYNNFENDLEPLEQPGCALLVYKSKFSTENSWVYYLSTLSALATTLQFSLGIFGKNQAFDASAIDTTVASFGEISQFVIPFVSILLLTELGHSFMAQKDNFKRRFLLPALLPFPQGLPISGTLTRIVSPPSNLTSLFDYAVLGPIVGLVSSLGFMAAGIAMPSAIGDQALNTDVLPSLSVGTLKLSTFGGSLLDYINGGSGFITGQANDALIPLSPLFIAGYCGMIISAVSLIPVGATNGGRMSLSIFGRQGHAVISAFTWVALLLASFTLEDEEGVLLTTALVITSLAQNDMEIACRNETDEVDEKRLVLGFALWFVAVLILVPI